MKQEKTRLSVPLSQELYKEIKKKSEAMGITMSSYVAFIVANQLNSEIMITNSLSQQVGSSLEDFLKKLTQIPQDLPKKDGE